MLSGFMDSEWASIKVTFAEPWSTPWVVPAGERDDYEIHLLEKGKGIFTIGSKEYLVEPGDIVMLHSLDGNSFSVIDGPFRVAFVTFRIKGRTERDNVKEFREFIKDQKLPYRSGTSPALQKLFYEMQKTVLIKNPVNILKLKIMLTQLILGIFSHTDNETEENRKSEIVRTKTRELVDKAIVYLQENYNNDICLEDMARLVNIHPRYFCTLFRQITGQTMVGFLKSIRLEKAKRLLLYTSLPVTEIALDVGFNNSQYFSRVFKSQEGISPGGFRRSRM
jgi:AraC-like DNA-binding protein